MKYTEEEKRLIEESFRITRMDFPQDPKIDNDQDVIKALKRYFSQYNMGSAKAELMWEIFEKFGLWHDGITTIKDHQAEVDKQRLSIEKRLVDLRSVKVLDYDSLIKRAEKQKDKVLRIPERLRQELDIHAEEVIKRVNRNLLEVQEIKEKQIRKIIYDYKQEVDEKCAKIIENGKKELVRLRQLKSQQFENELNEESKKLEEEFKNLMESDTRDREIENLEKERDRLNYERMTKAELKELADKKGLEYNARILKADLIKLVKENI